MLPRVLPCGGTARTLFFVCFLGFHGIGEDKGKPMPMLTGCFHGVFKNKAFPMPFFQSFFMGFLDFQEFP